jgi:hypothetical protein
MNSFVKSLLNLRQDKGLCCINLDGHVIYRYNISGDDGLAVDQQGHVYISGLVSDDIHRLSIKILHQQKYKNPSFTKNIKILHQQNIKSFIYNYKLIQTHLYL